MREEIKLRTKRIGIEIIKLISCLPQNPASWAIAKQIVRSSTSIGANYRAACRAKSNNDFLNKLKIVEEEADETLYWIEILEELKYLETVKLEIVKKEVNEILSITVSSIKTTRNKQSQSAI